MTTKQIDYILELANTKNFNRAAENLFISQPTMTYQTRAAENEIGFSIFERSGKGAALTPAGAQFVTTLKKIRDELKAAIEQGQNFSARFKEDISIVLPIRSAICFLPKAIWRFNESYPEISVTPHFDWDHGIERFMSDSDLLFAMKDEVKRIPDIKLHKLFDSRIYLITQKNDPLAGRSSVNAADLKNRTLMVGGGSPPALQAVQQRVISETGISYFNSHDHDTTLTNVAARRGVCLAPGFLNDHTDEFAWIPFECAETIPCVICTHKNDKRDSVRAFVMILQKLYEDNKKIPV